MTRVVVVDDHPIFRKGLIALLRASDVEVVGEAGSGLEALAVVADTTCRGAEAATSRYAPEADRFSSTSERSAGRFCRDSASTDGRPRSASASSQHSAVSTASAGR